MVTTLQWTHMLKDDAQKCTALSVSFSLVKLKTQQNKLNPFSALASANALALTAINDSHCQGRAKHQCPELEIQMRNHRNTSMENESSVCCSMKKF